MSQRINYNQHSSELIKKLLELSQLNAQGFLGPTLTDLVHIRASQLNGCAFCLDMRRCFSDKERAALEWTEALTKLGAHIPDSVYEQVRAHLSEEEIADLTFAIGIINFWNRLNIGSPTTPGSLDAMLGLSLLEHAGQGPPKGGHYGDKPAVAPHGSKLSHRPRTRSISS